MAHFPLLVDPRLILSTDDTMAFVHSNLKGCYWRTRPSVFYLGANKRFGRSDIDIYVATTDFVCRTVQIINLRPSTASTQHLTVGLKWGGFSWLGGLVAEPRKL